MSTDVGQEAEAAARAWLESTRRWKCVAENWRTRGSEIDLIMQHKSTIHFVEVKYRQSAAAGQGYMYVTALKQSKLLHGVKVWLHEQSWSGSYQVDVVSVSGDLTNLQFELYENALTQD